MRMISDKKSFFLIGIKGAAMVNIAVILKKMGKTVSGIDVPDQFPTDEVLIRENIGYFPMDLPQLPEQVDVIIYSAAHKGANHALVKQAKKNGVTVIHQAAFIGEFLGMFQTSLAVAGCHGKTTTSSLLAYALIQLGKEPSYLLGTPTFNEYLGGDFRSSDYFVLEADEYGVNPPEDTTSKLSFLHPSYSIILNVDHDHPDVFENLQAVQKIFTRYARQIGQQDATTPRLILCADDAPTMEIAKKIDRSTYVTYGFNEQADYVIRHVGYSNTGSSFAISRHNVNIHRFTISLFGEKSVSNAAAVVVQLLLLGFKPEAIAPALSGFTGAKRRFELVAKEKDTYLFDDYAHHPHELEAVIGAVRKRFHDRNLIVIFQPHTYSRTEQFKQEFIYALSLADAAIIAPIFASAREEKTEATIDMLQLQQIAEDLKIKNVIAVDTFEQVVRSLPQYLTGKDIILTAGAGDIYTLKDDIISVVRNQK